MTSGPLLLAMPGNETLAQALASQLNGDLGRVEVRRFPDEETYVQLGTAVERRHVAIVCTLDRPDPKLSGLLFVAHTARDLGASRVGLIAPYLAYMRQDKRFRPGEAVASVLFSQFVCGLADWLITVDPHLHRVTDLQTLHRIPARVVHAAPAIADWIRQNVVSPLVIGPDEESAQWVNRVAGLADAPSVVLRKVRHGDRDVEISLPDVERWRDATPVLVDDIISTARTMIGTIGHLKDAGLRPPVCIGVHAVFAQDALDGLVAAGAARVVTCNTVVHQTNAIDLSEPLASGMRELLRSRRKLR